MQNYQNSSTYELENSFSEKSFTVAMAINQDNKILITSSLNYGKAFQFKWGSLKTMKLFQTQQRYITNINFFKKNSQFVTCSIDSSIIIWSSILLSLPKYLQKLNSHKHSIYCLAIRPNDENLIISGGVDCTIKFWSKKLQWSYQQTIKEETGWINALSINQDGNQLISRSLNSSILVICQTNQQRWIVKQKIITQKFGYRLNFIHNEKFAFQQSNTPHLSIYVFNHEKDEFVKQKEIQVSSQGEYCDGQFPSRYIKNKSILICKNGPYLNLIKFNFEAKGTYEVQQTQSVYFQDDSLREIYGTLSDDGEHLFTWDNYSKKIKQGNIAKNEEDIK